MSNAVIFDTSVYLDDVRFGRHGTRIDSSAHLVRLSSVVLSELWRGARHKQEHQFLAALASNHPILTPTTKNWLESGQVLTRIAIDTGFTAHKLRDLHFDVLIALTARSWGARLITSNKTDFELIQSYRHFELEVW